MLLCLRAFQDYCSSPWSTVKAREVIKNEDSLAKFLADVDKHILGRTASAFLPSGGSSPALNKTNNNNNTASLVPGTPRVLFPLFPKGVPPPKFGEGELPGPMSLQQFHEGLRQLGILDNIEHWRDSLRQWFSSVLLKPLVHKLDTSHWQVSALLSPYASVDFVPAEK